MGTARAECRVLRGGAHRHTLRTSSKGAVLGKYLGSLENYNFSLVRKTHRKRRRREKTYLTVSAGFWLAFTLRCNVL